MINKTNKLGIMGAILALGAGLSGNASAVKNKSRLSLPSYNFLTPPQVHRSHWPSKPGWRAAAKKRRYKELTYRRHRNSRWGRN
jgi:hypothetical protein